MIRVIYRWRVECSDQPEFIARWKRVTNAVHQTTEGALGSFCLQDLQNANELLTVALWEREDQWRRFIATAKSGSMNALHEIATQLSATPYRQLGDETVSIPVNPRGRYRPPPAPQSTGGA